MSEQNYGHPDRVYNHRQDPGANANALGAGMISANIQELDLDKIINSFRVELKFFEDYVGSLEDVGHRLKDTSKDNAIEKPVPGETTLPFPGKLEELYSSVLRMRVLNKRLSEVKSKFQSIA